MKRPLIVHPIIILWGVTTLSGTTFGSEPLWRRALGGAVRGFPAQGPDGSVYITADDRALHALDPLTGAARWTYRPGGRLRNLLLAAPDGSIYIQNDRLQLIAVTPGGTGRWKLRINAEPAALPAAAPDGRLILPLIGGRILCISRRGVILWAGDAPSEASAAPVVDTHGTAWIPLTDGSIIALDPLGADGGRLFLTGRPGAAPASILAMDTRGRLWAGSFSGRITVFNITQPGAPPEFTARPSASRTAAVLTDPQGRGRIHHADGTAVILSPEGKEESRSRLPVSGGSPALAADGTLYLPAADGTIHLITPQGGPRQLRGRSALAEPLLTRNSILIAGGADWILYAWSAPPPAPGWSQFRGGQPRTGTLPAPTPLFSPSEARTHPGFFYRERQALSPDISERLALITELESFPGDAAMYRELPWASLLLEHLTAPGTTRRPPAGREPLHSHALVRARAYRLIGRGEDFRPRRLLLETLNHEQDDTALAAGFEALGSLGVDWDGASMRLIAARYRAFSPKSERLTLAAARAAAALIRYNGGMSHPSGYALLNDISRNTAGAQNRSEILALIRGISGL